MFHALLVMALSASAVLVDAAQLELTLVDTPTRTIWITDGWPKAIEEGRTLGGAGSKTTIDIPDTYGEPYVVVHVPEENRMAVIDARGVTQFSTGEEDRRYLAQVKIKATDAGEASLTDSSRRHAIAMMGGAGTAFGVAPGPVELSAGGRTGSADLTLESAVPIPTVTVKAAEATGKGSSPSIAIFASLIAVFLGCGIAIASALRKKKEATPTEGP